MYVHVNKKLVREKKRLEKQKFMLAAAEDYNEKLLLSATEKWKIYYEEQMYVCLFLAFTDGELL